MKHTPSPWLLADDGSPFVYALNERNTNRFYCGISSGWVNGESASTEEMMANAHLIAAAPDLYAALDRLMTARRAIADLEFIEGDDESPDDFAPWQKDVYAEHEDAWAGAIIALKKARNES